MLPHAHRCMTGSRIVKGMEQWKTEATTSFLVVLVLAQPHQRPVGGIPRDTAAQWLSCWGYKINRASAVLSSFLGTRRHSRAKGVITRGTVASLLSH